MVKRTRHSSVEGGGVPIDSVRRSLKVPRSGVNEVPSAASFNDTRRGDKARVSASRSGDGTAKVNRDGNGKNLAKSVVKPRPPGPPNLYGSYRGYHRYRVDTNRPDPRLDVLPLHLFRGKVCLDIGCSSGEFTLSIAEKGHVATMVGIDIDPSLIQIARKNLEDYEERHRARQAQARLNALCNTDLDSTAPLVKFPISFEVAWGPLSRLQVSDKEGKDDRPLNVQFYRSNYATGDQDPYGPYDVICCFSVVKWIHLNWGDAGLKRVFRKIYQSLVPGGIFILEPQPWKSYRRQYCVTESMRTNLAAIKIRPSGFTELLLSDEIGFSAADRLGKPSEGKEGFRRPVFLYRK